MDIRLVLSTLCYMNGMTLKDLASKVGINYNGLINKLTRQSMQVKDLEKLLSVFDKELAIVDRQEHKDKKQ